MHKGSEHGGMPIDSSRSSQRNDTGKFNSSARHKFNVNSKQVIDEDLIDVKDFMLVDSSYYNGQMKRPEKSGS